MHRLATFFVFCLGISLAQGDTWLPGPPSRAVTYASGNLIRNGTQFLVYGGQPITNEVQVYDFESNSWTTQNFTNLPTSYGHCSALDDENNILYVFGGVPRVGGVRSNQLWSFNIDTGDVVIYPNYHYETPANRSLCTLSYWGNTLFMYSGSQGLANIFGDFWQYNLSSMTWTRRYDVPYGSGLNRTSASYFTTKDGLWLIFGGYLNSINRTSELLVFNHHNNSWWYTQPLQRATADSAITVTSDNILLLFGGNMDGFSGSYYNTLAKFNLNTGVWVVDHDAHVNATIAGRWGHVMGVSGDKVIITGGSVNHVDLYVITNHNDTQYFSSSEVDPSTESTSSGDFSCIPPPSMFSLGDSSSIDLPSQPNVQFSLNPYYQNYLEVQVEFDFVQDNSMYIWDFVPSDYTNDQAYWFNQSDTSNHGYSIHYFRDPNNWLSPSSACYLDRLSYQFDRWSLWHTGYNRMHSSASFDVFSLSQQNGWSVDSQGNLQTVPVTTVETIGNEIVVRGTLYIYLTRVRSAYSYPVTVDNLATWKYPFEIRYEKFVTGRTNIVVSSENPVDNGTLPVTNIHKLDVLSSGKLIVSFDTELQSTEAVYAGNPIVISSPIQLDSITNVSTSTCVSPCTQRWTFVSDNVSQSYSGNYTFAFQVLSANGKRDITIGSYFTVKMRLELEIRGTVSLNGSLSSSLQLFQDNIYSSERNYFNTGDVVVAVHSAPYAGLRLRPQNAWFCVQDSIYPLTSCLYSNSSVQLICDGFVCPGAEYFNATIQSNPFYGVIRFVAQPLVGNSTALYVLEISSVAETQKRQISAKTYVRAVPLRITEVQQPTTIPEDNNVSSDCANFTPSFLLVAFFVAFGVFRW